MTGKRRAKQRGQPSLIYTTSRISPPRVNLVPVITNRVPITTTSRISPIPRPSRVVPVPRKSESPEVTILETVIVEASKVVPKMEPKVMAKVIPKVEPRTYPEVPKAKKVKVTPKVVDVTPLGETPIIEPLRLKKFSDLNHQRYRHMMHLMDYWHKFILRQSSTYEKDTLMRAVFASIYPSDVIPVKYQQEETDIVFYARNCANALEKVFRNDFIVPMLDGKMLAIEVVLCYVPYSMMQIELQVLLNKCIKKKYCKYTHTLDLKAFHKDPELSEVVYCHLSQQRMFNFVLSSARAFCLQIQTIDLSHNDLNTLKPQSVWPSHAKVLDLSYNQLEDINVLNVLKPFKVVDLRLGGNPLCKKFQGKEGLYVSEILSQIPTLKKLDGVFLGERGAPCWRRNFLISFDAHSLVDQFLEHYFTLFDGENRQRLKGVYHNNALFSLTTSYMPGQSTSSTARLTLYKMESRNMLKISDYSKSYNQLSHGADKVMSTLCKLPRTEHDPTSFAVDVMQSSADHVWISISGVFREPSMMKNFCVRSFNRTFILLRVTGRDFQIVNEMLHVSNATTKQAEETFRYPCANPKPKTLSLSEENMSEEDKKQTTGIFSQLTEMNFRWSKKCLNESKWDLKEALLVFTELLKMEKIPKEAFAKD